MQQPVGAELRSSGLYIIEKIAWYDSYIIYDINHTEIPHPIKKKSKPHTAKCKKDAELKEPCKAYANPYLERGKYNEQK